MIDAILESFKKKVARVTKILCGDVIEVSHCVFNVIFFIFSLFKYNYGRFRYSV